MVSRYYPYFLKRSIVHLKTTFIIFYPALSSALYQKSSIVLNSSILPKIEDLEILYRVFRVTRSQAKHSLLCKNKQMRTNQTYKLLHSKGNHKTKRQPLKWEKILVNNVTNKGLIFKIYRQLLQLNIKKKQSKNGQKIRIDISLKKTGM